jgi:uncharacterized protein YjlB
MPLNKTKARQFIVNDDGIFPNSRLPIIFYPQILKLPKLFASGALKKLFQNNNWENNWKHGIYTYNHYHSTTHEVLGFCKGETLLMLGGEKGITLIVQEGDVIIIPAGVAHMNLGNENDVTCIGGYPEGRDYDMNYGNPSERPRTDHNIKALPLPITDPVFGKKNGLMKIWKQRLRSTAH